MKTPKRHKPRMHLGQPDVALAVMAAHWNWLVDNPNYGSSPWNAKQRWPGFEYWGHDVATACVLCEHGVRQGGKHKCYYCLIPAWRAWRAEFAHKCMARSSIYAQWCKQRAKEAALTIRDMALTELAKHYQHRLTVKMVLYNSLEEFFKPTTNCGAKLQPSYNIYAPNRAVDGTYYFGYSPRVVVSPHDSPPPAFLGLTSQQYVIAKRRLPTTHFIADGSVEAALDFWNTSTLKCVNNTDDRTVVFKEFLPILPMTRENYDRWFEIRRSVAQEKEEKERGCISTTK